MRKLIATGMLALTFTSTALAQNAPGICPSWTNAQATAVAKATAKHLRAEGKHVTMASCAIITAAHSKQADVNCVFIVNGKTHIKNISIKNRCALTTGTTVDPLTALIGQAEAGL